jgi:hypothetical protein
MLEFSVTGAACLTPSEDEENGIASRTCSIKNIFLGFQRRRIPEARRSKVDEMQVILVLCRCKVDVVSRLATNMADTPVPK